MGVRVLVRAASLIAVALTSWANNVRWGSDSSVRGGLPMQWERWAVGAALLSALAALAIWLGTRAGVGPSRIWLRGAACLFALGVAGIAVQLRREADRLDLPGMLEGPGWTWLAAGAGVALAAAAGSFAVRGVRPPASQRSRARRSGAGRRGR
jgi:hypothetical protein